MRKLNIIISAIALATILQTSGNLVSAHGYVDNWIFPETITTDAPFATNLVLVPQVPTYDLPGRPFFPHVTAGSSDILSPKVQDKVNDQADAKPDVPSSQFSLDPRQNRPIDAEFSDTLYMCACGCGIFEVGTSSMLPEGQGGTFYLEYDFQNQNRNWHGSSRASAADNDDKDIRTDFLTAGLQYMFNRSWGLQVEIPYDFRHFETTADDGSDVSLNWGTLGDIRVEGIYTGFSPDLSTGVTFGLKLPTGSFKHNDDNQDIDRDSELGTGSTDVLLGGFYRNSFTADNKWTWFAQVNTDLPVFTQEGYRPGDELDAAVGIYYSGFTIGKLNISPVAQVLASVRTSDSGPNAAHPVASGYERLLLSPGIEFHYHPFMIYADVEIPVFQDYTGDQLTAPVLFKLIVSYSF